MTSAKGLIATVAVGEAIHAPTRICIPLRKSSNDGAPTVSSDFAVGLLIWALSFITVPMALAIVYLGIRLEAQEYNHRRRRRRKR